MTFLETANSKPNCKQQTAAASIFAHFKDPKKPLSQFWKLLTNQNRLILVEKKHEE